MDFLVTSLKKNYLYFFFLFVFDMTLSLFLLLITWNKKESSVELMQDLYKDLNDRSAYRLFIVVFFANYIFYVVMYFFGFYSLLTKKLQKLKIFSNLILYSIVMTIFIIYINM